MDVSTKRLTAQMEVLTAAYDALVADCRKAAKLYGEKMYSEDFPEEVPEVVTACSRVPSRKDETPEALSIMFDAAFAAFSALASQITRDKPMWSSEDPTGLEMPSYDPDEEWLEFVSKLIVRSTAGKDALREHAPRIRRRPWGM